MKLEVTTKNNKKVYINITEDLVDQLKVWIKTAQIENDEDDSSYPSLSRQNSNQSTILKDINQVPSDAEEEKDDINPSDFGLPDLDDTEHDEVVKLDHEYSDIWLNMLKSGALDEHVEECKENKSGLRWKINRKAIKKIFSRAGIMKSSKHRTASENSHLGSDGTGTDSETGTDSGDESDQVEELVKRITRQVPDIDLYDLNIVATLGKGGFGRVELVQDTKNSNKTYALKVMSKHHIKQTKQEEHTLNEKDIMLQCKSKFIVNLFKTYRDDKFVYMLMEPCLGGEVWSLLRDKGYFDDKEARFYVGCVMGALDYLHSKGIVYRDLKPENVLIKDNGYAKLVDFGFAKKIGTGDEKTWTFCGTPEYVAPEIVLNKGHGIAADYWSLGIFIFELLTGSPPWSSTDTMRTYNSIIKGIDEVDFPTRIMSKNGISIIKELCRDCPDERLGFSDRGMDDIRQHCWFDGLDFDALHNGTMTPPIKVTVTSDTDVSNFDHVPPEAGHAPPEDDFTGWDETF